MPPIFSPPIDFVKLTPRRKTAPSYRSSDGKTHFRLDAMANHRRRGLGTPPLERGTVDHAHQPSNGTLQPAFRLGGHARCSCKSTRSGFPEQSAHTPAALFMAHSMCDVAHLRPALFAQSVMHRAEPCRRLAHHIEARPPLNESLELRSRLSPQ